jgi:hypothetical protein
MRKTIRLTITLPEHTPAAAMEIIRRVIDDFAAIPAYSSEPSIRGILADCLDEGTANSLLIAVDSLILPNPASSDLADRALASVSDAEWAAANPAPIPPARLQCAGASGCTHAVGMIDREGYVYCGPHGLTFRGSRRIRTLTQKEIRTLQAGGTIRYSRSRA